MVLDTTTYVVHLEVPDGFGEKARGDQVQEASGDDQEGLNWSKVSSSVSNQSFPIGPTLCVDLPVDEVSDQATTCDASDHG